MIRNYITQAITMMRQHKLFTGIYIAGTALAISFTMVLFILYYIKIAPIYPEYNRSRTMVLDYISMKLDNTSQEIYTGGYPGFNMMRLIKELPSCDKACLVVRNEEKNLPLSATGDGLGMETAVLGLTVSDEFWQIFDFEFIAGVPMLTNGQQLTADEGMCVISESFAKKLYGTTDVVGRDLYIRALKAGRICGVVKDVSGVMRATAADIYMPIQNFEEGKSLTGYYGAEQMFITTDNPESLKSEVADLVARYDQADLENKDYELYGQPHSYTHYALGNYSFKMDDLENNVWDIVKRILFLLVIPALNLCALISSRMDERIAEFGVRKAYGASSWQLVKQILCENLFLTCVGGLAGIIISYIVVCNANDWIFQVISIAPNIDSGYGQYITPEMLFNIPLVLTIFLLCVVLNLISALVPALWALKNPIVYSLNSKR